MNIKVKGIPIVIVALGKIPKVLIKGLENHLDDTFIKIGQNTEKSSGDLSKLSVT